MTSAWAEGVGWFEKLSGLIGVILDSKGPGFFDLVLPQGFIDVYSMIQS